MGTHAKFAPVLPKEAIFTSQDHAEMLTASKSVHCVDTSPNHNPSTNSGCTPSVSATTTTSAFPLGLTTGEAVGVSKSGLGEGDLVVDDHLPDGICLMACVQKETEW